jgi:hypothetical protein
VWLQAKLSELLMCDSPRDSLFSLRVWSAMQNVVVLAEDCHDATTEVCVFSERALLSFQ